MRRRATLLLLLLTVFIVASVIQSAGLTGKSFLQPVLAPAAGTATATGSPTPFVMCTAPYCPGGSLVCPTGTCPGGCGVVCVTNTATPTPVTPQP